MIINNTIIEYDVKSAGLTALYHLDLITLEEFEKYANMDKKNRIIELGNHIKYLTQLTGKIIYRAIEAVFDIYIEIFKHINHIEEHNILERNHDAIWLSGRRLKNIELTNEDFKLDIVKPLIQRLKIEFNMNLVNEIKVKFVPKHEYTLMVKYKDLKIYLDSISQKIAFRGANPDPCHMFYSVISDLMLSYEYNDNKLYDKLHKHLHKLEEDENYYGTNLINNIPNGNIIKYFIKEMI